MKFPAAISEHGDLVAGIVAITDASEDFPPLWLRIKRVKTDKTERLIQLIGGDLMSSLMRHCRDGMSRCVHLREIEERASAANAVLAENSWRVFPCYRDIGPTGSERLGPGCEKFRDVEVKYQKRILRITHRGHILVNQSHANWAYRGRLCTESWQADAGPMAFDPETGLLLVWMIFWAGSEVCDVPPWEFHPIRLPALRSKAPSDHDGGAP